MYTFHHPFSAILFSNDDIFLAPTNSFEPFRFHVQFPSHRQLWVSILLVFYHFDTLFLML